MHKFKYNRKKAIIIFLILFVGFLLIYNNTNDIRFKSGLKTNTYREIMNRRSLLNKYFDQPGYIAMQQDTFRVLKGKHISRYDDLIRQYSKIIKWDWRLLAALIYRESRFNPQARSYNGAYGLMQLMPSTASRFGATDNSTPEGQIQAGVNYLKFLDKKLSRDVRSAKERQQFVLASYNVGISHILDARRLAEKNGKDPNIWLDNVDFFLKNKSSDYYLNDPEVKYGSCPCEDAYYFVNEVLEKFRHYSEHFGK